MPGGRVEFAGFVWDRSDLEDPTVKMCACCAASYDRDAWSLMPLLRRHRMDDDEPTLEYRNCPCGSTLAVDVDAL